MDPSPSRSCIILVLFSSLYAAGASATRLRHEPDEELCVHQACTAPCDPSSQVPCCPGVGKCLFESSVDGYRCVPLPLLCHANLPNPDPCPTGYCRTAKLYRECKRLQREGWNGACARGYESYESPFDLEVVPIHAPPHGAFLVRTNISPFFTHRIDGMFGRWFVLIAHGCRVRYGHAPALHIATVYAQWLSGMPERERLVNGNTTIAMFETEGSQEMERFLNRFPPFDKAAPKPFHAHVVACDDIAAVLEMTEAPTNSPPTKMLPWEKKKSYATY